MSEELSTDKHCEMLTAHIRDCNARITDGFKLFVQLFSAIVGAAVWLRLQQYQPTLPSTYIWLTDGLTLVVVFTCGIIVADNLRSWYGYRVRLSDVAGRDKQGNLIVPRPNLLTAAPIEATMLVVMILALILFCVFNPLQL